MSSKRTRYRIASVPGFCAIPSINPFWDSIATQRHAHCHVPPAEGVDMKSNYFKKIAGTAVMAFSLILGISSVTAAQWRDPYQNDRYRRQQQEELRRQQA